MAEDEGEVKDLGDLHKETLEHIARISRTDVDIKQELVGTVLPLLADMAESMLVAFEEIQDLVNPVKLSGAEAHEIGTLLGALVAAQPQLKERIDVMIVALDLDPDEEDDENPSN